MARRKKRMLRKAASHVDTDGELTKQSIHSPPYASQELLAERRKLSSELGRIEEEIGVSKPGQDLPRATSCRKKSLCHYAAPVKAVMDSPTSISMRSARRMLSKEPSPKGESDANAASQGGEATQRRSSPRHIKAAMDPPPSISTRSLRHIVDNKPRDVLKCPPQPNLPTASPEAATKSEPAAFTGSPAANTRGSPCRATYKVIGTSSKGSAAAPNTRGSRSRAKVDPLLLKSPIGATDKVIGTTNNSSAPAANTRGRHSRAMEKELLPDPVLLKSPISATTNRGSAAAASTSGDHSSPMEKEVSPDPLLLQSPTGSTDEMIGTTNKGSAAANTRGSHSQAMEKEVSSDPSLLKSPISATDKLIGTKRKRGPTKFKGIDLQSDGPIIVRFNSLGQPVGEGSVSLSSFLGPLVRFIVPYTINDWRKIPKEMKDDLWARIQSRYKLDKDWQKDWCMKEMAELWRTSKSRLVSKLNKLPNDEQRLQLKPHNIKSEAEWRAFVQEKTSEKFQERSNKFREMRKNQLPHTCSRRGYARTIDDMNRDSSKPVTWVEAYVKTHLRKNGEPVNLEAAEVIEKLQELVVEKPESGSSTTKDDDDDPLTILFDPDKPGRSLANVRGVTSRMLAILRGRDDRIARLEEQQSVLKNQMTEVLSILHNKAEKPSATGFIPTSETQPHILVPSPKSDNTSFTPQNNACNLLDWSGSGKIVAEGRWFSSDPECTVHHVRLGPNAMKVWVDVVKKPGAYLWRPTVQLSTIDEVVGSTVAWPADKVLMRK